MSNVVYLIPPARMRPIEYEKHTRDLLFEQYNREQRRKVARSHWDSLWISFVVTTGAMAGAGSMSLLFWLLWRWAMKL